MVGGRQLEQLPVGLARSLPADALVHARSWWEALPAPERRRLDALWEESPEDPEGEPEAVAVLLDARFLASPDHELFLERAERREHAHSLYEWAVQHDDMPLFFKDTIIFGVCRAHPMARSVLRAGVLPADLQCPLGREACPMRRMLAVEPGRTAELSIAGVVPRSALVRHRRSSVPALGSARAE